MKHTNRCKTHTNAVYGSCDDVAHVRMRTDIDVSLVAQYYPIPLLPRIGV
jgi:hypothetical protein